MMLNRRILRELKSNWVRYGALTLLIIIAISMVVGMAGATDAIFYTVDTNNIKSNLEDGEFETYVPLTEKQINELSALGADVEEEFYIDLPAEDGSTLRIFKNRESINKITLDQGNPAAKEGEIAVEKHYAEQHGISIGSRITVAGGDYTVTGIGSAPDYSHVLQNVSDVLADMSKFSISFVSEEEFGLLAGTHTNVEYNYSYVLSGDLTASGLKKHLTDMDFDKDRITNRYMKEIIDEIEKGKNDLKTAVGELADGSEALKEGITGLKDGTGRFADAAQELSDSMTELDSGAGDLSEGAGKLKDGTNDLSEGIDTLKQGSGQLASGLSELTKNNQSLTDAAAAVFSVMLHQANEQLKSFGADITLTQDNYSAVLQSLISSPDMDQVKVPALKQLKTQLENYQTFLKGLAAYTQGVSEAYQGAAGLSQGAEKLSEGAAEVQKGAAGLEQGLTEFKEGTGKLSEGTGELNNNSEELDKGAAGLEDGITSLDSGTHRLQDEVSSFIEDNMNIKYVNLCFFLQAEENQRITGCEEDASINKVAALIAGIIIITLLAYMISIFVIHNIEKESSVIGALYSMGYVKKELMRHFMVLPMVLVGLSAFIGTAAGFLAVPDNVKDSSSYYSYPDFTMVFPPYLILYGIAVPVLIAAAVNLLVINGKLSQEPLKLLRREKKQHRLAAVDLRNMGFINRYRIRQLLREIRGNITMFFGLFIAILLTVFGFCIYGSINSYVNNTAADVKYEYLYILKYPPSEAPANSSKAFTKSLNAYFKMTGSDLEVALQGIDEANPYFDFPLESDENEIYVSSSAANKLGYKEGDKITLTDPIDDRSYNFTVKGIVSFSTGLYLFMDIDAMRNVFQQDKDYYNTLMSEEELTIDRGRIASVITVEDILTAAKKLYHMMSDLIVSIISVSIILFIIVMYLLLKMIVDKAAFSISLLKIFGYDEKEVKKIYLGSTFITVLVTAVVAIPSSKVIMNRVYPLLISNVSAGMKAYLSPALYLIIIGIIAAAYLGVNFMVGIHLKKISYAEILKERE